MAMVCIRGRMADKEARKKREKKPILRWRGLLAEHSRRIRLMVLGVLFVASASLTLCQLGFIALPLFGGTSVYAMVLLLPVIVAALLLGPLNSMLLGFLAGVVLCIHAQVMPLDFYEFAFINEVSSFVMLSISGLLAGIMFAFALRNNPPFKRRAIYCTIVCFVTSWLYSIGFEFNVFMSTLVEIASDLAAMDVVDEAEVQEAAIGMYGGRFARMGEQAGNFIVQALLDTALMAFACIGCDVVRCRIEEWNKRKGIRSLFYVYLGTAIAVVFMAMMPLNFIAVSLSEQQEAFENMKGTLLYLQVQEADYANRVEKLEKFLEGQGVDPDKTSYEEYSDYENARSFLDVLDGLSYTSGGVIFESSGSVVVASNIDGIGLDEDQGESTHGLEYSIVKAIEQAVETGEMQRVVYDKGIFYADQESLAEENYHDTSLAFLYSVLGSQGFNWTVVRPADVVYADREEVMVSTTLSAIGLLFVVFILVTFLLRKTVLSRIDETNEVLGRITGGDLDARVDVRDTVEFESLSSGINTTVGAMKDLIAEAETRMDEELATAKAIQESALPRTFPPFPDILKFDIYASMATAKEVGGDFYCVVHDGGEDANPQLRGERHGAGRGH